MFKRSTANVLLAVLLGCASVIALPAAGHGHPCLVPGEQQTIEVEVKILTKRVARGDIAKILVHAYRPARENLAGSGQNLPPDTPQEPAGNVRLTIGILTGNQLITQNLATTTNDEGKRLVKVRLGTYHRRGYADVRVKAFMDHFSERPANTCVEIQEGGFEEVFKAFVVR